MPTSRSSALRRSFVRVLVLPALTLLLVPILAIGFTRWGEHKLDGLILDQVHAAIARDGARSEAERAEAIAFFDAHPPSAVCGDPDPRLERYRAAVCARWSEPWQFTVAERVGWGAAAAGVGALLLVALLGLVAFWNRRAQRWSFLLGWRALVAVTALETAAQGALLVWLSYWVTALVFERYFLKLILLAAVAALAAVVIVIAALFRRPAAPEPLEAERIGEADAPGLWRRVRDLAARLGTAPPTTLVAGIDDNFFVTEQPLPLQDGTVATGRLLYASLPLLRTLAPSEADAVFGHELAHFHGGDTAASARLAPMLVRYDAYTAQLGEGGLARPAWHVMRLYRAIFELALAREQRRRELLADAAAVQLTSADDLGRSLLKIVSYSGFRAHTEAQLFNLRAAHQGELALRARIDQGLAAFAGSPTFVERLQTAEVPHPFDSHPPLADRLAAVGARIGVGDAPALLASRPAQTWADEVLSGAAVEERLWAAYEARFKESHAASLAWRLIPRTDAELARVKAQFPDLAFETKKGALQLTFVELVRPDGARLPFAEIEKARLDSGSFSSALVITRRGPDGKTETFKVDVRALGKRGEEFKKAFSLYWQRDQVARRESGQLAEGEAR